MKICLDPDNANLNTAQPNPIILGQTEHGQHFTLVKCHICSRTFDTIAKFSHHLRSHKLSPKIYYDCNDKHIWSLLKSEPNNYMYCCVKCRKLIYSSIPYKDFMKNNE